MVEYCFSRLLLGRSIYFKTLILLSLLPLASACARVANTLQIAPSVSGTVTKNGRPVEGAGIELLADPGNRTETTRTNASGQFQLPKIVEVQPAMLLLGDRAFQHRLVISQDGKRYLGVKVFSASGLPFKTMSLQCELTDPVTKLGPTIEGLCVLRRGS